jgi:hypothetical protein
MPRPRRNETALARAIRDAGYSQIGYAASSFLSTSSSVSHSYLPSMYSSPIVLLSVNASLLISINIVYFLWLSLRLTFRFLFLYDFQVYKQRTINYRLS